MIAKSVALRKRKSTASANRNQMGSTLIANLQPIESAANQQAGKLIQMVLFQRTL